jgi:NAD(P)-dependent dehydrogenase (short-subunit alcohol dehydrogenase family)
MDMADTALFNLAGRVAVVTGGAKGIGAGIVEVLAEAGATVVVADSDRDSANACVDALTNAGHHAIPISVDLADEESVIAASAAIAQDVGAPWLLVNNAALQDRELLLEASASHWDTIHTINARGSFLMTREIAKQMVAAGRGGRNCEHRVQCVARWNY